MTQLPDKANFSASGDTQAGFRNALDELVGYLSGLFGTDGLATTARARLGLGSAASYAVGGGSNQLTTGSAVEGKFGAHKYDEMPRYSHCVFYQASAPVGWVQQNANDRVLRVSNSGGAARGNGWAITGLRASYTALSVDQLPTHNHGGGRHYHRFSTGPDTGGSTGGGGPPPYVSRRSNNSNGFIDTSNPLGLPLGPIYNLRNVVQYQGRGQSHGHTVSQTGAWRPPTYDVILCYRG